MKIGRFEITSDKYQWILIESYDGKDKDGNPKIQTRESYYGSLEQCCLEIVNRDSKLAEDVAGMIDAISASAQRIVDAISASTQRIVDAFAGIRR